ncbi:protein GrpE-like isoform X2 [Phoenix dactylifera]|uniref:Protein GrpE-like isoform X2 n=1 Tax=Phoenix dactylifera TaxID=42345 RepID=A0A8B8J693_PHODC|nr:protein GrpE-like isoform X2 [Phoenix dactylifera]
MGRQRRPMRSKKRVQENQEYIPLLKLKRKKTSSQADLDDEILEEDGANDGSFVDTEEKVASAVMVSLQSYKEALANNDPSKVAEVEAFLQLIEAEKNYLAAKVVTLTGELSKEQDRILRIRADFDNFRKRMERKNLSLMTNLQGEVIESLLPVLDEFESAKAEIKVDSEGEEKINNSYQSIYKRFLEILNSLGVEVVETVGNPYDHSEQSLHFLSINIVTLPFQPLFCCKSSMS